MKNIPTDFIPPALFDETNAAAYIGATTDTLKLSRHTGFLYKGIEAPPHIRCGRAIRYSREALDLWLSKLPEFSSNADARARGFNVRVIPRKASINKVISNEHQ